MTSAYGFVEPHKSRFVELLRLGAGSADIHDSPICSGFAGVSRGFGCFIEREIARPEQHIKNICKYLKHLSPVTNILDVGCSTGGLTVALAWTFPSANVVGIDP